MNVIMYGMNLCPDCIEAINMLRDYANINIDYHEFTQATAYLKEFLKYRDSNPIFYEVKNAGNIGIPFFVTEDNFSTFDVKELVHYVLSKVD